MKTKVVVHSCGRLVTGEPGKYFCEFEQRKVPDVEVREARPEFCEPLPNRRMFNSPAEGGE